MSLDEGNIIKLPSKGLIYPEGHPFHKLEQIEINLISGADENILTNESYIRSGVVIDKLLEKVLSRYDNLNVNELLIGDYYAILVYCRLLSLGTEYPAKVECNSCHEINENIFNLDNIPIRYLDESAKQLIENGNLFEYTTKKGCTIQFSLLTLGMQKEIDEDLKAQKKILHRQLNLNEPVKFIDTMYNHIIKSIKKDGKDMTVSEFLSQIITESQSFRNHLSKITPRIDFISEFTCKECGALNEEVRLPIDESFFRIDTE